MSYKIGDEIINKDDKIPSERWRNWQSSYDTHSEAEQAIFCMGMNGCMRGFEHNNKNEFLSFKLDWQTKISVGLFGQIIVMAGGIIYRAVNRIN